MNVCFDFYDRGPSDLQDEMVVHGRVAEGVAKGESGSEYAATHRLIFSQFHGWRHIRLNRLLSGPTRELCALHKCCRGRSKREAKGHCRKLDHGAVD